MTPGPTRRLAVLGSPIAHSLSPTLQGAAYRVLDLPFEYGRAEVPAGGLRDFLATLDESWLGLSLTMPLKREVVPLLDTASALVQGLGVANTVVLTADRAGNRTLAGYNTDVDGIVRAVRSGSDLSPRTATILGGGATAASALAAASVLGADACDLFLRDPAKAGELVALAASLAVRLRVHPLTDLASAGPLAFVISTLPGGAADAHPLVPASPDAVLLDVAYDPWPSRLAQGWADAGGLAFSGLDMLVEQAIGQVRLFTGGEQDAPLERERAVRAAMRAAVDLPG